MTILAWIAGLGAMAALFSIYQQNCRERLLACKLTADVCWGVHYFCLGGYGGMVPNFVGIFRELIFLQRDKKRWANAPIIPVLFVVLNWGIGFSTFSSPVHILPIAASTFGTVSLWLRCPKLTKIISIPVSLTFLIYDLLIGSWIGMVNEALSIGSIILSFLKERKIQ